MIDKKLVEVRRALKENNLEVTTEQELEVLQLVTTYGLDLQDLKLDECETIEDLLG